ncbi:TIGR03986 family type III CRISPR-associated RAMP protein [Nocardia nova]
MSTAWFRLSDLQAGLGKDIRSGTRFTVAAERFETVNARTRCVGGTISPAAVTDDSAWRLLLTDTAARDGGRSTSEVYFVAARHFGAPVEVTVSAWSQYLTAADGAEDLRTGNTSEDKFSEVTWPPPPVLDGERIGSRYRVARSMTIDQPLWVRRGVQGQVVELRPAQLWRYRGGYPVRDRMPVHLQPCDDWRRLCPSCAIFGSADTRVDAERIVAEQNSYAGHVGFSDAIAENEPELSELLRAPLMAPRPSAGQFYLDYEAVPDDRVRGDSRGRPAAYWGSTADEPAPRHIRGRKFYWHTNNPESGPAPRGRARQHQENSASVERVNLIRTGARFGFTVAFDGLSRPQLGGLIASLQPELLFPSGDDIVVSLGGGRPFGFGSVSTKVEITDARNAAARYLGASAQPADTAELVEEFVEAVDPGIRQKIWPEVAVVLRMGAVENSAVWYPPGEGRPGDESYDRGFDFWSQSSGRSMNIDGRTVKTRMVGPPCPTAKSQHIDLRDPRR